MADKKLIAVFKPPKPISQMTERELDAFVAQVTAQVNQAPSVVEAMRRQA